VMTGQPIGLDHHDNAKSTSMWQRNCPKHIHERAGGRLEKPLSRPPLSVLNDAPYLAVWSGYFLSVGVATFASTLLLATRLLTFLFL
jgi:hypothetical protein